MWRGDIIRIGPGDCGGCEPQTCREVGLGESQGGRRTVPGPRRSAGEPLPLIARGPTHHRGRSLYPESTDVSVHLVQTHKRQPSQAWRRVSEALLYSWPGRLPLSCVGALPLGALPGVHLCKEPRGDVAPQPPANPD